MECLLLVLGMGMRKRCRNVVDMGQAYKVMTLYLQNDIQLGSVVVATLQNCRSVLAVLLAVFPQAYMEQV